MSKSYIIVKHAGPFWHTHFKVNPKQQPQDRKLSVHNTPTGAQMGVLPSYLTAQEAQTKADEMNVKYPSHDYGVCEAKSK